MYITIIKIKIIKNNSSLSSIKKKKKKLFLGKYNCMSKIFPKNNS